MLPMLLPSGMSVDTSTLEEYQKREATWGRPPNDPFTGVPFTSTCRPLPNPQLKSRIDRFLLQKGMVRRDGALGGQDQGQNPQASRLVTSSLKGCSQSSPCSTETSVNSHCTQFTAVNTDARRTCTQGANNESRPSSKNWTDISYIQQDCKDGKSEINRRKEQDLSCVSAEDSRTGEQLLPQSKKMRTNSVSEPSCSSHEQLLSASLDDALFSALQGRPSFTSNLLNRGESTSQSTVCQSSCFTSSSADGKVCSKCSSSVSVYSTPASSIYRLICGHLLCRSCVQKESKPTNSTSISSYILCPTCQSSSPRIDILRVHH